MPLHYVTLGEDHVYRINGITVDCDCVVCYDADSPEDGRNKAFEYFGAQFCFEYHDKQFNMDDLRFFPRGIVRIDVENL